MSLIAFLFGKKQQTASIAKERLQVIITHEHENASIPVFFPEMRDEIIRVIEKYLPHVQKENIQVQQDHRGSKQVVTVCVPFHH